MATKNMIEEEGIFQSLREQYGSIDTAMAAHAETWAGTGAWPGISDEASLREALEGPQHDQIIAILIGLAKAPEPREYGHVGPDVRGNGVRSRTETVDNNETITIHAEKNQDIEVENDETHWVGHARAKSGFWGDDNGNIPFEDDGPSTLLGSEIQDVGEIHRVSGTGDWSTDLIRHGVTGDWNGDGQDTLGFGDTDGDADVDATDFAV